MKKRLTGCSYAIGGLHFPSFWLEIKIIKLEGTAEYKVELRFKTYGYFWKFVTKSQIVENSHSRDFSIFD